MHILLTHDLLDSAQPLVPLRQALTVMACQVTTLQVRPPSGMTALLTLVEEAGLEHPVYITEENEGQWVSTMLQHGQVNRNALLIFVTSQVESQHSVVEKALAQGVSCLTLENSSSEAILWMTGLALELSSWLLHKPPEIASELILTNQILSEMVSNLTYPSQGGRHLVLGMRGGKTSSQSLNHWLDDLVHKMNESVMVHSNNCSCCTPAASLINSKIKGKL